MQFLASKNIAVLAYPLVHLILLPVTSSFLQKSNSCSEQSILCWERRWEQKCQISWTILQKMICCFAFNSGSIRRGLLWGRSQMIFWVL